MLENLFGRVYHWTLFSGDVVFLLVPVVYAHTCVQARMAVQVVRGQRRVPCVLLCHSLL